MKWYENAAGNNDVFTAARVRIVRDIEGYRFPEKMNQEERKELTDKMKEALSELLTGNGGEFRYIDLQECTDIERQALRERRVINETAASGKKSQGLFLSQDESTGIALNGDDHIRIHKYGTEMNLNQLWGTCDRLDDLVNSHFPYAFDDKYGYLTAFPTSMGTGLKVSVILHLPFLSEGKAFRGLLGEVGRMGIQVKGIFGEGNENYGGFFEVSNMKTLGQSEEEILSLVYRMASHLAVNERKARSMALRENRLLLEDQVYKSYGIIRYAKQISEREAEMYLSHLRAGMCEGLIQTEPPINLFGLMWECRDASIREKRIGELTQAECNVIRAEMIRESLPDIYNS